MNQTRATELELEVQALDEACADMVLAANSMALLRQYDQTVLSRVYPVLDAARVAVFEGRTDEGRVGLERARSALQVFHAAARAFLACQTEAA